MSWKQVLVDSGLSEREADTIILLSSQDGVKASELAKEIGTTRLDAYNSLSRLQEMGIVMATAQKPMIFSCETIDVVVGKLIDMQKTRLKITEEGLADLQRDRGLSESENLPSKPITQEPRFGVLKDRVHIFKRIKSMASEAEDRMFLLLGRYGILHLCRSDALSEVNSAAQKGVVVNVLSQLNRRTIRFFDELDDSIEIRHSDDLSSLGALRDESEVIQFLQVEENPVGKGRDDAALVIESDSFAATQANLVEAIWEEAVEFDIARKRFTEEKIVDPLRLTVGEGSFLESFTKSLGFSPNLPVEDTPFDPQSFLASGSELNEARLMLQDGKLENLKALGIDIGAILRQVGNRIGRELAFSLRTIKGHLEFLNEMMDWWEHAGLGELDYEMHPTFHVKVIMNHEDKDVEGSLPLAELDDGIIEGVLNARYPMDSEVLIRREDGDGEEFSKYHLIFRSEGLIEMGD